MKVALLVCGQMRGVEQRTLVNINKNLVKSNVDVYISTWKTRPETNIWSVDQKSEEIKLVDVKSDEFANYIDNITDVSLYDNINLMNEFNMHKSRFESREEYSSHGVLYNQYLIEKAIDKFKKYELEKNIVYDIIVKIRPDFSFGKKSINLQTGEKIYLSKNTTNRYQASDKFFYSNRELFIYFINCLRNQIQEVLTTSMETDPPNERQKPKGERFYRQVLNYYKIPSKVVIRGRILRSNKEVSDEKI